MGRMIGNYCFDAGFYLEEGKGSVNKILLSKLSHIIFICLFFSFFFGTFFIHSFIHSFILYFVHSFMHLFISFGIIFSFHLLSFQ